MFRNYLKIMIRNLERNKVFSFVNIFGLAIGLSTCLLIMLYIYSETGYEQQNPDVSRIFRIASMAANKQGGLKEKPWAAISAPVAAGLKADFPEVEQATRLLKFPTLEKMLLTSEQGAVRKVFYETNGYYVDSNFFQIFPYEFRFGHGSKLLNLPNSMVISGELSEKLFGQQNPLGKVIDIGMPYGNFKYTITGVFNNEGLKTHIPAHFFLSMNNGDIGSWVVNQDNWATNNIFHTYIKLKAGANAMAFEKKLPAFLNHRGGADFKAFGVLRKILMQPLADIHLHSDLQDEIEPNGNISYLYILGSIAAFVLIIACVNFMNLSTARSGKRAKEVGVRKVIGAEKKQLVLQFLGESLILCIIALVLAAILTSAVLPLFEKLTGKNISLGGEPKVWICITLLTLITGIISGLYPAFYLSSFKPVSVLKGKITNHFSAISIRRALVIFQFSISICLILAAFVFKKQLYFLQNQELGFEKEQKLVIPLHSRASIENYSSLKNKLLAVTGIKAVTAGSSYPGVGNVEDMLFYSEGKSVQDVVDVHLANVEPDYLQTLGLKILAGRGFANDFHGDSDKIVLNQSAIDALGYNIQTAVGKKIYFDFQGQHSSYEIVGVLQNFNFESLYNSIKPYGFTNSFGEKHSFVIASIVEKNYSPVLKQAEAAWIKTNPGSPFVYSFMDQDFQLNYEKDQRMSSIIDYFTLIAIAIACLGLFGLSAFSAEQRMREIGIRKVLGASAANLALLLSREFVFLILISFVIASPLAWLLMKRWLQDFAYRSPISWWLFLMAALFAIAIGLLTVGFQAIRAALSNPVKVLKAE